MSSIEGKITVITRRYGHLSSHILTYGGYHKIRHFACHRDFFVHQIPRIKHRQNASYPGMKHFQWLILFSTNDWLWNVLYPRMKHCVYVLYVGFHAKINLCHKQNVLFYGTPVNSFELRRSTASFKLSVTGEFCRCFSKTLDCITSSFVDGRFRVKVYIGCPLSKHSMI